MNLHEGAIAITEPQPVGTGATSSFQVCGRRCGGVALLVEERDKDLRVKVEIDTRALRPLRGLVHGSQSQQ